MSKNNKINRWMDVYVNISLAKSINFNMVLQYLIEIFLLVINLIEFANKSIDYTVRSVIRQRHCIIDFLLF